MANIVCGDRTKRCGRHLREEFSNLLFCVNIVIRKARLLLRLSQRLSLFLWQFLLQTTTGRTIAECYKRLLYFLFFGSTIEIRLTTTDLLPVSVNTSITIAFGVFSTGIGTAGITIGYLTLRAKKKDSGKLFESFSLTLLRKFGRGRQVILPRPSWL
jgi:hypothetical protein